MTLKGLLAWFSMVPVAFAIGGCGSASDPSAPTAACLTDVSAADCEALKAIELPAELPAARGNPHAEEFNAQLIGFHVFFDSRFSKNLNVRCESCHSVDHSFGDNLPVPMTGLAPGVRNAPTIFNAARYETFLWDGRADTLWSQPLLAFENPTEMDFSRPEIVHLLNALYEREYVNAFGELPDFSDLARFPARGAPGVAAYDAMTDADKQLVNGVVANLGKALEAYMRKVATGPSPVDAYLSNGLKAKPALPAESAPLLSAQQERGMAVFANSGCLQCHNGPQLSDNRFHNLGVPAAEGQALDPGRSAAALMDLSESPFNMDGPFFDGPATPSADIQPVVLGGFRTPSLRNLAKAAPYGHNGVFKTLEAVVDFHLQGGGTAAGTFLGDVDPLMKPTSLTSDDRAALIEFLKALAGSYPALPWSNWPGGTG